VELSAPALPQRSLPRMLMMGLMDTFLTSAGSHLAGDNLAHTCRILGRMPDIHKTTYASWKLGIIEKALQTPGRLDDQNFRWPELVPAVAWMTEPVGATEHAQPEQQAQLAKQALLTRSVQQALVARLSHLPMSRDMTPRALRFALADIIALAFTPLSTQKMSPPLQDLFKLLSTDKLCTAQCPALANWNRGTAQTWSQALLDLVAREQGAPFPIANPANTFGFNVFRCAQPLTSQLVLALAQTGHKGIYRIGVAPGLRRPINALIDSNKPAWEKAGLKLEVRTGLITLG
jgi:hypothetical protein